MKTSEQISKITEALTKFQGEVKGIVKDAQGHGYKYITLDQILALVRPVLTKYDIALIQDVQGKVLETGENIAGCVTRIVHVSGEWIETEELIIKPASIKAGAATTPRDLGSAITYAKRYQLTGLLGLSADLDDDAAAVSENLKSWGQKISTAQTKTIATLMTEKGIDKNAMYSLIPKIIGVSKTSSELTSDEAEKVIKHLSSVK